MLSRRGYRTQPSQGFNPGNRVSPTKSPEGAPDRPVPEGRSDRSLARSAWNSPTPKEPSRRARYDQAQTLSQRYLASKGAPCFSRKANHFNHRIGAHPGANQTVPYGTALLRWRCPRHFVPGYDRTVPPGLRAKSLRGNKSSKTCLNFAPFNPGLSSPPTSLSSPEKCLANQPGWQ